MASADLIRAQYQGGDFDTYLDDLRARMQVKFGADYNDFSVSSLGMLLLDSVSFGLDSLSFYLDRRATDSYLATARTRKSVSRLSRQLGYKMRPAVAASVDLLVTIQSPGFDVQLPKGFQFKGPDGLVFESAEAVIWRTTDGRTKSVPCYEGETITETFVASSSSSANQVFQLKRVPDQKFVVFGSVSVVVNGSDFHETEFLSFDPTDQFEVGYNDDPPTVRFGDGVAGNIPVASATIAISYVASRGKNGLVKSHTITKEQNPLVISFQTIEMTVDNPLGSVGGDDPEDLSHAKIYAPQVYKSRYVAITRSDYEALAGAFADPLFGRVAAAQAVSSRSAASDLDLGNYLAAIKNVIDAPLLEAAGNFEITGSATVATDGVVTGSGSKFLDELSVGSWVKFGTDATLRKVTAIFHDLSATVSPNPSIALASGPVFRYGKAITQARSSLKAVSDSLTQISVTTSGIATAVSTLDATLQTSTTSVRAQRDRAASLKADADGTVATLASLAADGTYGLSDFVSTPTKIVGVDADGGEDETGTVFYIPKRDGVIVEHVQGTGAVSLAVSDKVLTITLATSGSSAASLVALINGDTTTGALVMALCTGRGNAGVGRVSVAPYMPAAFKNQLQAWVSDASAKATGMSSSASSLSSSLDDVVTGIGTARQQAADIGLQPTQGMIKSINDLQSAMSETIGDTSSYDAVIVEGTIVEDLTALQASVVSNESTIQEALDGIYGHVDRLLSIDCKANLVTVPILTRDKSGFFTAPSKGLIRALQEYLDSRKEVTQTVQVTSGADALVPAVIRARVAVGPTFSESVAKTAVETAIDSVLRSRRFGDNLYLLELNRAIESVPGIVFANVEIVGPVSKLDTGVDPTHPSNGNLIIDADEVITKGQVTVTPETITKT